MLSIQKTEIQKEKERRENSPEQMELLQEELELEKEKKEIISSLYDDWIFEYNIREKSISTISGNHSKYQLTEGSKGEKTFLMLDGLHPEDYERIVENSGEMHNLEPIYMDVRIKRDEEYRWISMTTKVLWDRNGRPVSLLGKISDIDEKKREELRLQEQAMKDAMTGLLNRTGFKEKGERILEQARKKKTIPAMLIVDIDKFKTVNDHFGHLFGDTVIVAMADALIEVFHETAAAIGRFGGDEFTVLVPDADRKALEDWILELRRVFAREIEPTEESLKITCSIGVSRYGVDGVTMDDMLQSADSALYFVKEIGRDGYAICTEAIRNKFLESAKKDMPEEPKDSDRKISEEITEFAMEFLEGSKDLKSALNMLLMKIGKRFRLASAAVREYNSQGVPIASYIWNDSTKEITEDSNVYIPLEERKKIRENYRRNQTVEIIDVDMLPENSGLYRLYKGKGIQAVFQCPLVSEGAVFGYITYADVKAREWSETEKQSLSMISRVMGNYLAREHAYEKIARKVELMKSFDEVTGLLRYDKFKEVAQTLLCESGQVQYGIVSVDFAHFKYFNEIYGFRSGDEVLEEFASMVAKHNPRAVAACRDYADNFLIMVTVKDAESLYSNIENYNKTFIANQSKKFMDSKLELCSGAYIITNPEAGIVQAIDNANTARKIVKEKNGTGILLFEPSMKENRMREIAILHALEEALDNCEFNLYLQPKFSLSSGTLVGAEALARWIKQDGTLVMPDEFIPALEKSGKIVQLDFYMYELVLRQLRKWIDTGYSVVPVSVNLSRHHIKDEHLVEKLVSLLKVYDLESDLIEIEITESAFIEDQNALINLMKDIKKAGFGVSIDDFGTGYSSLSMLTELPADIVKLDKDFLKHSDFASTKGMLNNVIRLIKDNRMDVVCEGVEIEEQAEFLAEAGCDVGQGFYFSKPVPVAQFEDVFFK